MRTGKGRRSVLKFAVAVWMVGAMVGTGVVGVPAPASAADTVRGLQWYLDALKIPKAHEITKGRGVTIAVIDSGVDATHPALAGQLAGRPGAAPEGSPQGWVDRDKEAGHGTSMAGLIVGRGGDRNRQLGIAPEAKVLPIALSGSGGNGYDGEVARDIRWAADAGADVISLSIGFEQPASVRIVEAVQYALSRNVVLVAATGAGGRTVNSPANTPGVIAVNSTTRSGGLARSSVAGPEVVLAAPGDEIIAPVPTVVQDNGYAVASGTSQATAILAGVVALVRSRYPDLDAANVINRLIRTARDVGAPGRDPEYGFGAVDALAALQRPVPAVEGNPLLAAGAQPGAATAAPKGEQTEGPAVAIKVKNKTGLMVVGVLCLAVVVGAVVLTVVVARRRRRRTPPPFGPEPGGTLVGGPGFPPPGYVPPPGYGPPGGSPPSSSDFAQHPHPHQPRPQPVPPFPPPASLPGQPGTAPPQGSGGPHQR
ncbi:type VII secretion-associated serine protease mycosin [Micromonospora violae]|uniref:Type VII secretion-associated serine protease mycosin n=1 Tax=Micromonospora violae TaxID=1278207 RepID=A0A4Q7UA71_9ACTN|nr:S8 family serine peptidase [Micromonospora violae]RZT77886.1 type VII secretion-associated serine protease mycosin [Micromonospora violae]